ncbi:MAG: alanine--glyoxylate aminotransferase family protein [Nitrososphaerota archaeon]
MSSNYFVWGEDPLLMIPGPVELDPKVRQVLGGRFYPHYGAEWGKIYSETTEIMKKIFKTKSEVIILATPGSLAIEMGIVNLANPGEKVVTIDNGFFGNRLTELSEHCGRKAIPVRAEMGDVVSPEQLKAVLDSNKDVRALLVVQNESSTGILNPIPEYMRIAKKYGLLTLVDSISAFGGVELDVDGWGIDFCIGYPNKCLSSIPSAVPVAISSEVWSRVEKGLVNPGTWFTNLKVWRHYISEWSEMGHPFPTTINTYSVLALKVTGQAALDEGLEKRYERHRRVAAATRAALNQLGLPPLAKDEKYASPTVTAARMPPQLDGRSKEIMSRLLSNHRIMIGGGLGPLSGRMIRVGHMGTTASAKYLLPTIMAISSALRDLGFVAEGAEVAAQVFVSVLSRA